jgi:hypothetical protein
MEIGTSIAVHFWTNVCMFLLSDNLESSIECLRKKKNAGVKVRKKNGQKCNSKIPGSDATHRQRLDLKGPRVKHVCRSASIVLGQPQATFPLDKKVEKIQVKPVQGNNTNMYTAENGCVLGL